MAVVRVVIVTLDDEHNNSRCMNAVAAPFRGQTAVVERRGRGPSDQEELLVACIDCFFAFVQLRTNRRDRP